MHRVFLSYHTDDEDVVARISYLLRRQSSLTPYFHPAERRAGLWQQELSAAISDARFFFFFVGQRIGRWQELELNYASERRVAGHLDMVVVRLVGAPNVPEHELNRIGLLLAGTEEIVLGIDDDDAISRCTEAIFQQLSHRGVDSSAADDLPTEFVFDYEKDIVAAFLAGGGRLSPEKIEKGCPREWPSVVRHQQAPGQTKLLDNPLDPKIFGAHRRDSSMIYVDARVESETSTVEQKGDAFLAFPEAGPRERILVRQGSRIMRVGILVSGGIAPGINAVVAAIVERHREYERASHDLYDDRHGIEIRGYIEGLKALCRDGGRSVILLDDEVQRWSNRGGSILPTSRADELLTRGSGPEKEKLLKKIVHQLIRNEIDILYVIGGEGSMRAAHAIWTTYRKGCATGAMSIVGVPKTMDNDILWVWQSFGFMSAVEKARQNIIQLNTEVISNPRVCVIQLFGSDSGYVVSHAALGSNVCDLVLIPEMEFTMNDVFDYMTGCLEDKWDRARARERGHGGTFGSPSGLIIMAETAIPRDVEEWMNKDYVGLSEEEIRAIERYSRDGWRVRGQTPDELRSGGLKVVSRTLEHHIRQSMASQNRYWKDLRVFTNEPRHLIRSMEPSVTDVIYGRRLGTMAVDTAMAGYSDCMVSQWLTEYVVVPLKLVVLGRKRMPRDGVFWRTAVANTGQMGNPALT